MCLKKGFLTKEAAQLRLTEIRKYHDKREKTPKRFYLCDKCGEYHLTAMSKSAKQKADSVLRKQQFIAAAIEALQTQKRRTEKEYEKYEKYRRLAWQ